MKSKTLKLNKDFRRLYYRGKSVASESVVTYAMKNRTQSCNVGITTSKKIGNAVQRNRSRRVIRVAFSQLEDRINGGWDFVFVARSRTSKVKMQVVLEEMKNHLEKIGVIEDVYEENHEEA